MLSRVANSVYWLNRYIERAENIARFIDVNFNLILDSPAGVGQQWEPLVVTAGDLPLFQERYGQATAENVIQFLTFDRNYPHSIISCLRSARDHARSVREIISREMWQQVNTFYFMVQEAAPEATPEASCVLHEFFAQVKLASHLFAGVTDATMSHNEGWHFGQMGRFLERADKTTRLLDVKYFMLLPATEAEDTLDQIGWMALLKSASAYEMYRKRSRRITPAGVAGFLVLEREFPRSIRFCLQQAESSVHQIAGTPVGTWQNSVERTVGRLRSELDYLTVEEIIQSDLHKFLDHLQRQVIDIDSSIAATFFAPEPNPVAV